MALDGSHDLRIPVFAPPERPPGLRQHLRSVRSVIEGWPAAVFEGGLYRAPLPGAPLIVSDPALAAEVLIDRADEFPHGEAFNRLFRPVWGRGLFTAEGPDWRWQRRAAAPAFRPSQMHDLAPVMQRAAEAAMERWGGDAIELHGEMRTLTLDILAETMLSGGRDFPDRVQTSRDIRAFLDGVGEFTLLDLLPIPDRWRGSTAGRGGAHRERVRAAVGAMVDGRQRKAEAGDLVDLLIRAEDPETKRRMNDALVRDNLVGFLAAGTDTSSNALTWALWLVSQHAEVEARLLREIEAVCGSAPIAPAHVPRLIYARQIVQETQRLFPGAVALIRSAARNCELGGHRVRRGTLVQIATYALHHRPDLWPDPARFDPERFDEGPAKSPPGAYLPFGAGPRICMGAAFAMTEIVVALAILFRKRRFVADPARPVRLGVRLGAPVAADGMWMHTTAR